VKLAKTSHDALNWINACVVGDSGIGKTTSLKTLPVKGTLVVSMERSILPLRNHDFNVLKVDSWQDLKDLYSWCRDPVKCEDELIREAIRECRVLAIDSLSHAALLCQEHILAVDRPALRTARKKKSEKMYDDLMTIDDWQLYMSRMVNIVSSFGQLPFHKAWTCLSGWGTDKQGNDVFRTFGLPGAKLVIGIPQYFDLVLHMRGRGLDTLDAGDDDDQDSRPERYWQTFHDGLVIGKDASGSLDLYEEPDWTQVLSKITGKGSAGKKTAPKTRKPKPATKPAEKDTDDDATE